MKSKFLSSLACCVVLCACVMSAIALFENSLLFSSLRPYSSPAPINDHFRRRCPLCDSSVYSYCGEKLFHDSCCCHNPNNPYDRLPPECRLADCSFLHSNSCYEHKLITACCCTNYLI